MSLRILIILSVLSVVSYVIYTKYIKVDCTGTWSEWSACDNDGTQTREFIVDKPSKYGGKECPITPETRNCPVDCTGSWGMWGDCDKTTGLKTRNFVIDKPAMYGGNCPEPDKAPCPVDCSVTWNDWGMCDKSGKHLRTYNIDTIPLNHGKTCPEMPQIEDCAFDCDGSWSDWSVCGDDGTQTRTFIVNNKPKNGGKACPSPLTETKSCQVDCTGHWEPGNCDVNCGRGRRKLVFRIDRQAKNNGLPCTDETGVLITGKEKPGTTPCDGMNCSTCDFKKDVSTKNSIMTSKYYTLNTPTTTYTGTSPCVFKDVIVYPKDILDPKKFPPGTIPDITYTSNL